MYCCIYCYRFVFIPASCVFGYPKNLLAHCHKRHGIEKPAQLGFPLTTESFNLMSESKNKPGRPEKLLGKRTKIIKAKLTEEEFNQVLVIEKALGINRMELIRTRVLHQSQKVLINGIILLKQLDALGAEMGRSGNNINQLARHANVLNNKGQLSSDVVIEFNGLFRDYVRIRNDTEKTLRQIIRLIKG
jgi:hypothetical protein